MQAAGTMNLANPHHNDGRRQWLGSLDRGERYAPKREIFQRVRARLRAAVGEDVFSSWFARLELEEIVDDKAHLSVPTRFLCSWIQSNYAERILEAFKAESPDVARLHFTVRINGQARPRLSAPAEIALEPEADAAAGTKLMRETAAPRGDALSGRRSILDDVRQLRHRSQQRDRARHCQAGRVSAPSTAR